MLYSKYNNTIIVYSNSQYFKNEEKSTSLSLCESLIVPFVVKPDMMEADSWTYKTQEHLDMALKPNAPEGEAGQSETDTVWSESGDETGK